MNYFHVYYKQQVLQLMEKVCVILKMDDVSVTHK